MVLLYGEFVGLLYFWAEQIYQQPQPLKYYGLERSQRNLFSLLIGLCLGLLTLLALFVLEGGLGWLAWQRPTLALPQVILEGLIVALGVGFAEELLFRGWLLDELERNYSPSVSLWLCSGLFALLHFLRPLPIILQTWPQFLGLLLLSVTLVWAKRLCQGRLGLAIGLHSGLVWGYYMINVANLVVYSGQVPVWLTGVDKNPLAGGMSLLFLGMMALGLQRLAKIR